MAQSKETVRTTIDIPTAMYRQLKDQAAQQGCSVRELVTRGIDEILLRPQSPVSAPTGFPLIRSNGPKVDFTNDQLYEFIEFP